MYVVVTCVVILEVHCREKQVKGEFEITSLAAKSVVKVTGLPTQKIGMLW